MNQNFTNEEIIVISCILVGKVILFYIEYKGYNIHELWHFLTLQPSYIPAYNPNEEVKEIFDINKLKIEPDNVILIINNESICSSSLIEENINEDINNIIIFIFNYYFI